jgi:hypothetical protein
LNISLKNKSDPIFGYKKEVNMGVRPKSVTIIAWILIAAGFVSIFTSLSSFNSPMTKDLMSRNPLPIYLQLVLMYMGLPIAIISGIGILKGKDWSRPLYVIWGIIGLSVNLITSSIKVPIIAGLIVFAAIVFFLYRPAANQYFVRK